MGELATKYDMPRCLKNPPTAVVYIENGLVVAENAAGDKLATGICNSEDNDRKIIEKVINYISSVGGGELHICKGTYFIEEAPYSHDPRNSYAIAIPPNINITGEGIGKTILKSFFYNLWPNPYQGAGYIFGTKELLKNENISIRDLTLDGNRNDINRINAGGACLTRADNCEFLRVEVKNAFGGIKLSSREYNSGIYHYDYKGFKRIIDCVADNCTSETFLIYGSCNGIISRNLIKNADYWIYKNEIGWANTISAEMSHNIIISGNIIDIPVASPELMVEANVTIAGILLTYSKNIIISNNFLAYPSPPSMESSKMHSIYVYNDKEADCNISIANNYIKYGTLLIRGGNIGSLKGISITNNTLIDANIRFKADSGSHAKFERVSICSNNMSFPTANHYIGILFEGAGISNEPSNYVNISNNIMDTKALVAAWVAAISAKNVKSLNIIGNEISNAPHQGIECEACEDVIIMANRIEDAGQKEAISNGTGMSLQCRNARISLNQILNSYDCGLRILNPKRVFIEKNDIKGSGTFWLKTMDGKGGGYSLYAYENHISGGNLSASVDMLFIDRNIGYQLENYGKATIAKGTSSTKVAHGLAEIPTHILISYSSEPKGCYCWISAYDSDGDGSKFTITANSVLGTDLSMNWHAIKSYEK